MLRPFADWAERAVDNGFLPVPMNGKIPAIKNWNGRPLGRRAIQNLITRQPKIATANMGFRTGQLVAIDIDEETKWQARRITDAANGMLGYTPFVRIGRLPRRMLFYRVAHEVESRKVGPVEILGTGKLAVVHGVHPDTGQWYDWPERSLLDVALSDVPLVRNSELQWFISWLEAGRGHMATEIKQRAATAAMKIVLEAVSKPAGKVGRVSEGERNKTLFHHLKNSARKIRSADKLLAEARVKNREFYPPLPDAEVQSVVASVWKYRQNGTLLNAGQQSVVLRIDYARVLSMAGNADAIFLALVLKTTRKKKTFTIEQKATATKFGWGSNRLKKAIDGLIAAGGIRIVRPSGIPPRRTATRYEFGGFLL